MLKIRCRDCRKEFIWSDDMPLQGTCPNQPCEGRYDVHAALRENLAARERPAEGLSCPSCGSPIPSRWTLCGGCGRVVAGSRTLGRRQLLIMTAVGLLLASLLVRAWLSF
jgi:predicted nucleic acid-binding Zn ribbon protein